MKTFVCDGCGDTIEYGQDFELNNYKVVNENFVPQDGVLICLECKYGEI